MKPASSIFYLYCKFFRGLHNRSAKYLRLLIKVQGVRFFRRNIVKNQLKLLLNICTLYNSGKVNARSAKCSYQKPVLRIRNDLFRIRIPALNFSSSGSISRQKFRIHADPDPTLKFNQKQSSGVRTHGPEFLRNNFFLSAL